jgi:hypothetical protein
MRARLLHPQINLAGFKNPRTNVDYDLMFPASLAKSPPFTKELISCNSSEFLPLFDLNKRNESTG